MREILVEEKAKLESELLNQEIDFVEVDRKVAEYRESLIKDLAAIKDARVNLINVKLAYIDELLAKYESVEAAPVEEVVEQVVETPFQETESEY